MGNSKRQKADFVVARDYREGKRKMITNGCRVSFWGKENILKLVTVTIAQLCECIKLSLNYFKILWIILKCHFLKTVPYCGYSFSAKGSSAKSLLLRMVMWAGMGWHEMRWGLAEVRRSLEVQPLEAIKVVLMRLLGSFPRSMSLGKSEGHLWAVPWLPTRVGPPRSHKGSRHNNQNSLYPSCTNA